MNTNPGNETASELYPNIAAVGAIYGDPNGTYASFLSRAEEAYPAEPYFMWDQPLSDLGWVSQNPTYGGAGAGNNTSANNGNSRNSSGRSKDGNVVGGTISLATLSMLASWLLA